MKKMTVILMALIMLLMCMTACSGPQNPEPMPPSPPDDSNPSVKQTVFDLLNELSEKDYSKIDLDIVTKTEFAQLYANYSLTQNNVTYSIEQLNLLPTDGKITDLPSSCKSTVTGCATIENGRVVELDGDKEISLPSYDELKGNFSFNESNFKNVTKGNGSFEAEVISPSQFYGTIVDMSDLKVRVEYSEASLIKITVSYSTKNATVQTVYAFTIN